MEIYSNFESPMFLSHESDAVSDFGGLTPCA